MKKTLFCVAVLFFVLTVSVFAGRAEIDGALNSYEAIVVEAESLIGTQPFVEAANFAAIDDKAKAAEAAIQAVSAEKEWLLQDAKRSAELRTRFYGAVAEIVKNLLQY